MSETPAAYMPSPYIPSPLWGEGRVRGHVARGEAVRGEVEMLVVCESPRDFARGLRRRQTDAERRLWTLQALGYRVLRFWDNDAIANTDGVLQRIAETVSAARPSPRPSPQRGEGEGRGTLARERGEGRVRGPR